MADHSLVYQFFRDQGGFIAERIAKAIAGAKGKRLMYRQPVAKEQ